MKKCLKLFSILFLAIFLVGCNAKEDKELLKQAEEMAVTYAKTKYGEDYKVSDSKNINKYPATGIGSLSEYYLITLKDGKERFEVAVNVTDEWKAADNKQYDAISKALEDRLSSIAGVNPDAFLVTYESSAINGVPSSSSHNENKVLRYFDDSNMENVRGIYSELNYMTIQLLYLPDSNINVSQFKNSSLFNDYINVKLNGQINIIKFKSKSDLNNYKKKQGTIDDGNVKEYYYASCINGSYSDSYESY